VKLLKQETRWFMNTWKKCTVLAVRIVKFGQVQESVDLLLIDKYFKNY